MGGEGRGFGLFCVKYCEKKLRVCADAGDIFKVTACLIVPKGEKHPGRFHFHETLRGDGAIGDYSSSVSPDSY